MAVFCYNIIMKKIRAKIFKENKKVDIIAMILLPILAGIIVLSSKTDLVLISVLSFFGLPSLYISIRNHGIILKSLIFAFLFSWPLSLFVDTLAALDGSWIVPRTLFPFKFFGVATVEVYIYGLFWGLLAVLFYEHFFDRGKRKDKIAKSIRYLVYLFIFLIISVTVIFFINSDLLRIPYFYLLVNLIFVVPPLIIFLYSFPNFLQRYAITTIYFFFLLLLYEFIALETNQWIFPGQNFIGFVKIFKYRFPFEELFLWMVFATPSFLAYYEFFADDKK